LPTSQLSEEAVYSYSKNEALASIFNQQTQLLKSLWQVKFSGGIHLGAAE